MATRVAWFSAARRSSSRSSSSSSRSRGTDSYFRFSSVTSQSRRRNKHGMLPPRGLELQLRHQDTDELGRAAVTLLIQGRHTAAAASSLKDAPPDPRRAGNRSQPRAPRDGETRAPLRSWYVKVRVVIQTN
ncbi:hypothetical protein EYF80_042481 [Liparis tanakae]|uniref:Uncharacterized protein n=1 Tax=Liparis tanakae TaxID=230148 RepID=A0A4Z2G225_9TELE|nr:hypothetical protein EYF80_042481 [Liparis tanakae]